MKIRNNIFFYTYLIRSREFDEIYVGYTNDLKKRINEHNLGLNSSTKRYMPWQLIYYEACLDKNDAARRERYLKTSQGGRLIKRRLKEYLFRNKLNHNKI